MIGAGNNSPSMGLMGSGRYRASPHRFRASARTDHLPGSPAAPASELGLGNVAFEVTDLRAAVEHVAKDGCGLVGASGNPRRSALDLNPRSR